MLLSSRIATLWVAVLLLIIQKLFCWTGEYQYKTSLEEADKGCEAEERWVKKVIDDDSFVKSKIDKAKYRFIKLRNGLRAYIVSKEDTERSEVAISVNVGFHYDPVEIPGLSNLVQHSLLLASKQYPNIDEFHNFIKLLNGKIYLDLHEKSTIYSFTIGAEYLSESLFRISSYFHSPILNRDTINKAMLTIFNQLNKIKKNEVWVRKEVESEILGVADGFFYGGKGTLLNNPNLKEGEIYDRVLQYFLEYYSPNIMTLALVGRESLDQLQKYVIQNFASIKSNWVTIMSMEDNYKFVVNPFIRLGGKVVTIKKFRKTETSTLCIRFPVDLQIIYWKKIPTLYIKYLLDSNYRGVLRNYLKKLDILSPIKVATTSYESYSTLDISIELSNTHLSLAWEVVRAIISAVKFISEKPVTEQLLMEVKNVTEIIFNYRGSDFSKDLAYNIVYKASRYRIRPEEIIYADEIMEIVDTSSVKTFVNSINVDGASIFFFTPVILLKKASGEFKIFKSTFYSRNFISLNSNVLTDETSSSERLKEGSSGVYRVFLWIYNTFKYYLIKFLTFIFQKDFQTEDISIKRPPSQKPQPSSITSEINQKNFFVECNKLLKTRNLVSDYCINEFPQNFSMEIHSMNTPDIKKTFLLDISTPNPYSPSDLSLKPKDEQTRIIPRPLVISIKEYLDNCLQTPHVNSDCGMEVAKAINSDGKIDFYSNIVYFYYKNTAVQSIPEASVSIRIQTPSINRELGRIPRVVRVIPKLLAAIEILCLILKMSLEDEIFNFKITRNEFKISNFSDYTYNALPNGFTIILKGFYDVLPTFLRVFATHIRFPRKYFNISFFNLAVKEVGDFLNQSVYFSTSIAKSLTIIRSITENQPLSPFDRISELKFVTFEDIVDLSEFLARHAQIEGLFLNNISPLEAGIVVNEFLESLGRSRNHSKTISYSFKLDKVFIIDQEHLQKTFGKESQEYKVKNMLVPISSAGKSYFNHYEVLDLTTLPFRLWKSYRFEYSSVDEEKSVVSLSLAIGTKTPFTISLSLLSCIILSDLLNKFLKRIPNENGPDSIAAFSPVYYSSLIFIILQVDSFSKDVGYLSEFLISFMNEIFESPFVVEKNFFYKIRRDCINKFKELPDQIELFTHLFFTFIEGTELPFQWIEKAISSLENISYDRFIKFLRFMSSAPQILVAIQSKVSNRSYRIDKYVPEGFTVLNSTDDLLNQDNLQIYKLPINISRNIFSKEI
ncbi:secreted insulinase like peptidase [Cryptosporidium felis]|nr:secreted insulinase like peptidase [Cryptosporidium felis]